MTAAGPDPATGRPWLVTGAGGMLGRDLVSALTAAGLDAVGFDRAGLDVTDRDAVRAAVADCRPGVVVNCAAWTAVDDADSREAEALRVNGDAPRYIAEACAAAGARLLHMSTDYVFAGDADQPYDEDDKPDPRTAYGRTKLAGEQAVLTILPENGYVVRTAWLYGAHGKNFIRTMIQLAAQRPTVDVVDDQRGQPTWTVDVADRLIRLGRAAVTGGARPGVYHATSGGSTTWFDVARETFRLLGADPDRVRPMSSAALARAATRPAYSVLGHHRLTAAGIPAIRDWRDALAEAFPAIQDSAG